MYGTQAQLDYFFLMLYGSVTMMAMLVGFVFVVYMVVAVKQYGRWLRDNYADLEHKEVWQSLLAPMCLLPLFYAYAYHGGEIYREYLKVISISTPNG